jgi:hypothetical protein
MGFDFTQGATKQDVVNEQLQDSETTRTLDHVVRQNVLWALKESHSPAGPIVWIYCGVMKLHRGFGWGYNSMSEDVGPFYYSCPIKFLERAPVTNQTWRDNVRANVSDKPRRVAGLKEVPANELYKELFGNGK